MQMGSTLAWLLVGLVAAAAASVPLYARDKPRSIRGFKNHALSTARGFGKRADPDVGLIEPTSDDRQSTIDVNSLPAEWFANELQSNAALARLVVLKFLDSDRDGQLSAEELLRPLLGGNAGPPHSCQQ